MKRGFSLVELSIVLVILGLLTGGILAGQSLIRASELRSVSTEYQRWTAATQSFRDKYFAMPGDMNSAIKFWGDDVAACSDGNGANNGTPGTCNGNGDGMIMSVVGGTSESHQFWKQLALAGLVEGSYTGLGGTAAQPLDIIGTNVPASKMSRGGWSMHNVGTSYDSGAAGWKFAGEYGNHFAFGSASVPGFWTDDGLLKAEEAWNIDTKMDDGLPGAGRIFVVDIANCSTASSVTDYAATYKLTNANSGECGLIFMRAL